MRRSFKSMLFGNELDPVDFFVMFMMGIMISLAMGFAAIFLVTYPQFAAPALAVATSAYLFARFIGPRIY